MGGEGWWRKGEGGERKRASPRGNEIEGSFFNVPSLRVRSVVLPGKAFVGN